MVLKDEVINAFATLGLEPGVELSVASTAYKKAALQHHPDRNHGDASAKERFQKIGHAWSICQRHYENPRSSEKGAFGGFGSGRRPNPYDDDDDDDDYMDDDVRDDFFAWLFAEMMFNRYSHSSGRQYRREHAAHKRNGPRMFTFSGGFPSSGPSNTALPNEPRCSYQSRSYNPDASQKKQDAEFAKRVREFEREQAEEEAKIRNAEREAHSSQMRLASHQDRAFNLGKEGRGSEMRAIIEQHDLDVTKPRNLKPSKKQTKQADQSCFIETMLHVAAASCDVSLVNWLIQRGADTAALDPSRHTPFHVSILKGNIPVVECFLTLYRDTKSTDPRYLSVREGCHPSKASKDVQSDTPLQMAIKCGKLELMELLLKDATVHDVEKCWTQFQSDDTGGREIKELLLTKNGFSPPEDLPKQGLSRKAALKLQKQEEEKRAAEEKARRLAEEEANRLAKQARREKAEAERRAKREAEEVRAKEEAERLRIEAEQAEIRAVEQAERRRVEGEQKRIGATVEAERGRVETEQARIRAAVEAERKRVETEQAKIGAAAEAERKRVEAEHAGIRAAEEAEWKRVEAENAARKKAAAEESRRQKEIDERREAEEERRRRQKEEQERILRELEAKRKANEEQRKGEKAQRAAARQREREEASRRAADAQARAKADLARLTQMVQQKEEESKRDQQQRDAGQARLEAAMRRRAEQSARDKARAQRIREERAQAKIFAEPAVTTVPTPPTPPTDIKHMHKVRPLPRLRSNVPTVAVPVEATLKPPLVPISPPMTPEDLQTMTIPDDLFRYESSQPSSQDAVLVRATPSPGPSAVERSTAMPSRRLTAQAVPQSPATPPPSTPSDELSHHGNGVRCRYLGMKKGCKRGNQCTFSHVPVPPRPSRNGRRNTLEEELA